MEPEDGAQIVQKLLKNWTPAGEEEKEKEKERKEKEGKNKDETMDGRLDVSDDSLDSDADDDWDPYGGVKLDSTTRPLPARASSIYGQSYGNLSSANCNKQD